MGFSGAVQWWEEWQLRILVLGSLGVYCFLAIFGSYRKFSTISSWHRLVIWLSYLGSDALAIYGLATLFNRQKKLHSSNPLDGQQVLEVFWAPILLMHLGGQVNITAYNIEDNELWRRHILTSLSQVVVALYVFCKSWSPSADKRLLAAAVLLFVPGIFKCFEKPWALKSASFYNLVSSVRHADRTTSNTEVELEEYIQRARDFVERQDHPTDHALPNWWRNYMPRYILLDMPHPYGHRLDVFKKFWLLDDEQVFKALHGFLSTLFDLLYTKSVMIIGKHNEPLHCCALNSRMFAIVLPVAAIVLFHCSHKGQYKHSDVNVTLILLYVTLSMEIFSLVLLQGSRWVWSHLVSQQSLTEFFICNKRHNWLTSIAGCLQCEDFLNQYWFKSSCDSSRVITTLVLGHVKDGWKNYIQDAESFRKFSDFRGHRTLELKGCGHVLVLGGSLEKPFDESILLWHLATHFCFNHKGTSFHPDCASSSRQISNYMMHLLFANPEMLMPGSNRNLFTRAYEEIEEILHGEDLTLVDKNKLIEKITDKVDSTEGFVHDAWVLAQGLMQLGEEKKMWEVIQGVWVEILCFSAGRCRGYLHAKSLGSGGEYLSFVWLLIAYAGLETFTERQQRVQLRLPKDERVETAKKNIEAAAPLVEVEIIVS